MKLPRVRFTARRMMVTVAFVAVVLGMSAQLAHWRRAARLDEIRARRAERAAAQYKQLAIKSHERWLADCRAVDEINRKGGETWGPARYPPAPAFARRMADHLDAIAEKYHRAAKQPWWPLEPDPVPPSP